MFQNRLCSRLIALFAALFLISSVQLGHAAAGAEYSIADVLREHPNIAARLPERIRAISDGSFDPLADGSVDETLTDEIAKMLVGSREAVLSDPGALEGAFGREAAARTRTALRAVRLDRVNPQILAPLASHTKGPDSKLDRQLAAIRTGLRLGRLFEGGAQGAWISGHETNPSPEAVNAALDASAAFRPASHPLLPRQSPVMLSRRRPGGNGSSGHTLDPKAGDSLLSVTLTGIREPGFLITVSKDGVIERRPVSRAGIIEKPVQRLHASPLAAENAVWATIDRTHRSLTVLSRQGSIRRWRIGPDGEFEVSPIEQIKAAEGLVIGGAWDDAQRMLIVVGKRAASVYKAGPDGMMQADHSWSSSNPSGDNAIMDFQYNAATHELALRYIGRTEILTLRNSLLVHTASLKN